jgi:uncharacterized membrane protein YgdD (TMEM256/DUF423 family)
MSRLWLCLGALSGLLSVAAGAFGAHALKQRLSTDMLQVFETAARYEMYHALALLAVGLLSARSPSRLLDLAGWAFTGGVILFSGSLYALALTGARSLGAITPLGGLLLLGGWAALLAAAWRAWPE